MCRPLFAVGSVVLILSLVGCTSQSINAQSHAASTQPSETRVRAECPGFRNVAVKQATPVWCWAASAEMVHKYYDANTTVTQDDLAQKITNASKDEESARAAGLQEIMVALNPDHQPKIAENAVNNVGNRPVADPSIRVDYVDLALGQTTQWTATSDDLVDAIASKNPAIVGLRGAGQSMGHAVVVYAASYEPIKEDAGKKFGADLWDALVKDQAGRQGIRDDQVEASGLTRGPVKYMLSEVEYIDPMDGKRYKLNAEGFKNRVDFIMTKQRAREILDRQSNIIR